MATFSVDNRKLCSAKLLRSFADSSTILAREESRSVYWENFVPGSLSLPLRSFWLRSNELDGLRITVFSVVFRSGRSVESATSVTPIYVLYASSSIPLALGGSENDCGVLREFYQEAPQRSLIWCESSTRLAKDSSTQVLFSCVLVIDQCSTYSRRFRSAVAFAINIELNIRMLRIINELSINFPRPLPYERQDKNLSDGSSFLCQVSSC